MTEDEKKLLSERGFKEHRQDKDGNILAWKKEIRDLEMYIFFNPDNESYDVSCKDYSKLQESENIGKWKTLHNSSEDLEEAVEFADNWLSDNGYVDMDAVKPVFNADPEKIAEDVDELMRSIDGEEYEAAFPDKTAHIEELANDIRNGNVEFIQQYLLSLTLQENEAEQKMAQTMIKRLAEYDALRSANNRQDIAAVEMAIEDNYNHIDGILGNSAPKERERVNIKNMIEDNRRRLGLTGDTPDLSAQEMEQRNRA